MHGRRGSADLLEPLRAARRLPHRASPGAQAGRQACKRTPHAHACRPSLGGGRAPLGPRYVKRPAKECRLGLGGSQRSRPTSACASAAERTTPAFRSSGRRIFRLDSPAAPRCPHAQCAGACWSQGPCRQRRSERQPRPTRRLPLVQRLRPCHCRGRGAGRAHSRDQACAGRGAAPSLPQNHGVRAAPCEPLTAIRRPALSARACTGSRR